MKTRSLHDAPDVAVIGGGSAGMAAALAAGRRGLRVVLVESEASLGGTATWGGVNCWEMGVGGTGIPFDLFRRIKRLHPGAIGIYSYGRHFCWQDGWYWPHALDRVNFPGGELLMDARGCYRDTLRRHPGRGQRPTEAWCRAHWHGIPFLPEVMAAVQQSMLEETGNVTIRLETAVADVQARNGQVDSVTLNDGTELRAARWIDGAGGAFCHALGCETLRGPDLRRRFNEPSAPEETSDKLNGVTLIFKVMPGFPDAVEPLPPGIPSACWWGRQFPPMSCVQYPDLGRNCNMLPTMAGEEFVALGCRAAYDECVRRVKAYWHFLQSHWPEFRAYRLVWVAPMLGVRENRRVVCERMLTENDLVRGWSRQADPDIVALSDHAFDRHGEEGGCRELDEPYGVPYRCLIPKGWRNLLVAGRAAGFSSIAASSCRLTRTMMTLGQAAGTAAVLAARDGLAFPEVHPQELREDLRRQHVQLEWPLSEELERHLSDETDR